jgi:hypothetical protein
MMDQNDGQEVAALAAQSDDSSAIRSVQVPHRDDPDDDDDEFINNDNNEEFGIGAQG